MTYDLSNGLFDARSNVSEDQTEANTPPVGPNDELAYLQEIIAQHERHAFTVMALMAAVLTGLGTLTFSWKVKLTPQEVWQIGAIAIVAFSAWALSHRAVASKCIRRVREIEETIENGRGYKGPNASRPLKDLPLDLWWEAFWYRTNSIPIIIAFGVVFFMSLLAERLQSSSANFAPSTAYTVSTQAARSHVSVSAEVLINDHVATITTTVLPQICNIILERGADVAEESWSIKKLECK